MKKQLIPIVLAVSPKKAGWFPFVGRFGIDCHLIHLYFCVDPFFTQRNLPKNMEKLRVCPCHFLIAVRFRDIRIYATFPIHLAKL